MSASTARELRGMQDRNIKALEDHNAILQDISSIKFGIFKINENFKEIHEDLIKINLTMASNALESAKRDSEIAKYVLDYEKDANMVIDKILHGITRHAIQLEYLMRKRWWQFWRKPKPVLMPKIEIEEETIEEPQAEMEEKSNDKCN